MSDQVTTIISTSQLDEGDRIAIQSNFNGYEEIARQWSEQAKSIIVTSPEDKEMIDRAKEGRKFLKEKRLEIEKNRKALKEQSLRKGQAIDAIAKYLTSLIQPTEEYLESQEKFAELQEKKRLAELEAKRLQEISQYVENLTGFDLKSMSEEAYQYLLNSSKQAHEAKQEQIKKEQEEAEQRRKEQEAENERIRLENEKLKADQEKLRQEQEAERKKQEAILAKERAERERVEAELKAKQEAERKAQEEKAKLEADKLKAPDKEKLMIFANELLSLQYPEMQSVEAKAIISGVKELMSKVNVYIVKNMNQL